MTGVLYKEILPLFTCTKPVLRRKVCTLCYKLFMTSSEPEIVEELAPYLADRLSDSNDSVKMAAISSIHEIVKMNPKIFLVAIP